ncbi:hypothetical protein [Kutzneria sp. NPDC052558]|uniref:hypothetical protein n=1 Tax=Kutzneria sp. NPDC052558 TaxID=3364121 RepID=UPI0037C9F647
MRFTLHAGAALSALTLAACGAQAQPPQVASLTTADGAATSTPSTPDDSSRPQLRMDSSKEDINAAWAGYYACLKTNGHVMLRGDGTDRHAGPASPGGGTDGNTPDMQDESPASVNAKKACRDKLPLQPPELDQSRNPHYLDQYHAYLTCLTGRGVAVHAIDPFGSGWTYDDGVTQRLSEQQQQQVDHDCQLASFRMG